jgi:hypothetical protein
MHAPTVYRLGLIGLQVLGAHPDGTRTSVLLVRAHREGGLRQPLTPATVAALCDEAWAWAEREAEAGRDITVEDVRAASAWVSGAQVAAADFPGPSQS